MILKNKTILITGGSGGIGLALTKMLIQKGARVYSFDTVQPKEKIRDLITILVDITKEKEVQAAFGKIPRSIDVLINNAGVMRRGTIFNTAEKEFDLLFNVNVKGSWLVLKHARQYLSKKPTIVQMASRHGQFMPQDPAIYGLTKRAVMDLAEILKTTCPKWNIKVLCPGPIDIPLTWIGVKKEDMARKKRLVRRPEHLAKKIIKLLESDKTRLLFDPKKWDEVIC